MRLELSFYSSLLSFNEFQFHKGAIRTKPPRIGAVVGGDFNSIKVRLERVLRVIESVPRILFQFHKGAIRTVVTFKA